MRIEDKLGLHASATGELAFDRCRIPGENLLGERGDGFRMFLKILDGGRISIGALAVGIAQGAYDASVPYAQTRQQFGKPIGSFQGVAFMIADMATEIEAARALVWKAAWLKDQERDFSLTAAQAKLFASEVSSRVTNAAIQVHGGYGYVTEYPVERYLRDAKLTEIGEGTIQVQRLVIARRSSGCGSARNRPGIGRRSPAVRREPPNRPRPIAPTQAGRDRPHADGEISGTPPAAR